MALHCLKCKRTLPGMESLHLMRKCPYCGNTDRDSFIRVDDEDIDPAKQEKDREWLESHRAQQPSEN